MGKSYKKTPWCGDKKGKTKKRHAWKYVRQWLKDNPEELPSRNSYKKIYPSYDICDYGWICSWEDFWAEEVARWMLTGQPKGDPFPDEKEAYRWWVKHYKAK